MGRGYKDGGKPKMGASPRWGQAQDGGKPHLGLAPIFDPPTIMGGPQSWVGHNQGWATIMGGPQSWVGHNHGWATIMGGPQSWVGHLVACSLHPPLRLILPVPPIFMPRYVSTNAHQLPRLPVRPIVHALATRLILPGAGLNG